MYRGAVDVTLRGGGGCQKVFKKRYVIVDLFLARLLILIKKGGLLQLKFVGVGVNIYLWAQ